MQHLCACSGRLLNNHSPVPFQAKLTWRLWYDNFLSDNTRGTIPKLSRDSPLAETAFSLQAPGTSPGSCVLLPSCSQALYKPVPLFYLYSSQHMLGTDLKGRDWIQAFHHFYVHLTFIKRLPYVSTENTMVNKTVLHSLKKGRQTSNHTTV